MKKYKLRFIEEDLDFMIRKQAVHFFSNGYGISIINISGKEGGYFSYTNSDDEYEIAVLEGKKGNSSITYDTPITSDVIGYLKIDEVYKIMEKIEKLPQKYLPN